MADVIELAPTSRSRCRECRKEIEEGDFRFGSETSGYYGDSDSYHLRCAARRLPEQMLATLKSVRKAGIDDYDALVTICSTSVKKQQSQYPYGERAPTGRARCIQCKEPIAKDAFRIAVESEIVTGAFTRMGAAYLHPSCAVTHLDDPNVGRLLMGNSPLLSTKDRAALAAECDAAASSRAPGTVSTKKAPAEPAAPKPRQDQGVELVLADELMERGDVRGEVIMLESQLASMSSPADPRYAAARARADELLPQASRLWRKQLGKQPFALERGLPAIELKLSPKMQLPSEPWAIAVRVKGGARPYMRAKNPQGVEQVFAAFIQQPAFARVRRLTLSGVPFTWEGFRGFCSCDEVRSLEALDVQLNLGVRALLMLLGSTRFERLTELTVGTQFSIDPDARGFEAVAGLPSLRRLTLKLGVTAEVAERLLRSPLAQRLEMISTHGGFVEGASLPKLRHLVVNGFASKNTIAGLVKNRSLGALEYVSLGGASFDGEAVAALRSRFGAHVRADGVEIATKATPKKKGSVAYKRRLRRPSG